MKIIKTSDYTLFKVEAWKVNRMLPKAIKNLSKHMDNEGWYETSCIIVDENFNVIDGYYRLFAAMKSWIPVQYVMIKNGSKKNISKMKIKSLIK